MASPEANPDTAADASVNVDVDHLSEAQQLALQQYMSVTNQDSHAAVPLLRRSQWNVEVRITRRQDYVMESSTEHSIRLQ